jgi:hypothetical protein
MPYTAEELRNLKPDTDDNLRKQLIEKYGPYIVKSILSNAIEGHQSFSCSVNEMYYWKFIPDLFAEIRKEYVDIKMEHDMNGMSGFMKFRWDNLI